MVISLRDVCDVETVDIVTWRVASDGVWDSEEPRGKSGQGGAEKCESSDVRGGRCRNGNLL
jgi:hypothetical protein